MSSRLIVGLTFLLASLGTGAALSRSPLAAHWGTASTAPAEYTSPSAGTPFVETPAPTPPPVALSTAPEAAPGVTGEQTTKRRVVRRATVVRQAPPRGVRHRSWKKSALVIGGSTAAGAGVGALIGGKKGALIGAAIGAGGGTVYEVHKRRKHRR